MEPIQYAVLILLGVIGGLLHAVIEPRETLPKQLLVRVAAGVIVALIFGFELITQALVSLEPLQLFLALAPTVIGMAYVGMDLLKELVLKLTGTSP
jgi:hypothetical protein